MAATTIPITKRGAEKLRDELQQLKTVDRPAIITAIADARAQGDLSENADYDAAKERQGWIEGRIKQIEGMLSNAQVIDPSELDAGGRVVFGSTVELEDEHTGEALKYQIVGEDEADLKLGLVNVSSPIARALIGKEEGDTAEVQAPGGVKRYEIVGRQLPLNRSVVKDRIALLVAALWWGGLTTIGFLVVPMLFAHLGNPAMAGNFAGRLFGSELGGPGLRTGAADLFQVEGPGPRGRADPHLDRLDPRGPAAGPAAGVRRRAAHPGAREPSALAFARQCHVPGPMALRRCAALAHGAPQG